MSLDDLQSQGLDGLAPAGAAVVRRREIGACEGDSGAGPSISIAYSFDQISTVQPYFRSALRARGFRYVETYTVTGAPNRDALADVFEKETDRGRLSVEVTTVRRGEADFELLVFGDAECPVR